MKFVTKRPSSVATWSFAVALLALAMSGCRSESSSLEMASAPAVQMPAPRSDSDPLPAADFPPATPLPSPERVAAARLPIPVISDPVLASCAENRPTQGQSHRIQLTSASGEPIVFQVIEPKQLNCAIGHPVVLHGHGFGGSRTVDVTGTPLARLQDSGHVVVSIDQRGFGESGGTIRVMDPNFEGDDVLQILDWVEDNIDYLAHERPSATAPFNLVAGATGGSYGGMFQLLLHARDSQQRLDVLTPDITPHDLRQALNPNGAVKSAWVSLLVVGGEAGATRPLVQGLDPVIKETLVRGLAFNRIPDTVLPFFYYHSARYFFDERPLSEQDPIQFALGPLSGSTEYRVAAVRPSPVNVLFTQGFRDTLFNMNEAWANFKAYRALGGDVRLFTHQSGHILPGTGTLLGPLEALRAPLLDPLLGGLRQVGLTVPDLQGPTGANACGALDRDDVTVAFLNEQLRPPFAENPADDVQRDLNRLKNEVCVSLADNDATWMTPAEFEARATPVPLPAQTLPIPNSVTGVTGLIRPVFIPLRSLADREVVAGIARLEGRLGLAVPIESPTCALVAALPAVLRDLSLPLGCDATVLVGLGVRQGQAAPRLLNEQWQPIRGLGAFATDLVGVAYRAQAGDELGLMVTGYDLQYFSTLSREVLVPAVSLTGTLALPLAR